MRILVVGGFLYLLGVAIILILKPSFMFTEKGDWKEFGIGRSPATHTWMPFWLFIVLWAIISYILGILIVRIFWKTTQSVMVTNSDDIEVENAYEGTQEPIISEEVQPKRAYRKRSELTPGYYYLNRTASQPGIPKYVYLGPQLP